MKHHVVPRFLLKHFAVGKKSRLFVFDKHNESVYPSAVSDVAARRRYYELERGRPGTPSLEPRLAALEGTAAKAVKAIVRSETLSGLDYDGREALALFTVVQKLRVPTAAETMKHMNDSIEEVIRASGGDPESVEGFEPLDAEQARVESIGMLPGLARELVPHLLEKRWVLYRTAKADPFYISDNPVVMQNTLNRNPHYGTLGFGAPGIEIYLPLSGTLCLGFLCPNIEAHMRQAAEEPDSAEHATALREHLDAFEKGVPVSMEAEQVTNLNSLQVIYSSRFVYCSKPDFVLAKQMIRDRPALKKAAMPQRS